MTLLQLLAITTGSDVAEPIIGDIVLLQHHLSAPHGVDIVTVGEGVGDGVSAVGDAVVAEHVSVIAMLTLYECRTHSGLKPFNV